MLSIRQNIRILKSWFTVQQVYLMVVLYLEDDPGGLKKIAGSLLHDEGIPITERQPLFRASSRREAGRSVYLYIEGSSYQPLANPK